MTACAKTQSMCFMTIGYQHILLPVDKGLKVMELLQHAVDAEMNYRNVDDRYIVKGPLNIEIKMVKNGEVDMPPVATTSRSAPKPPKP